MTIRKTTTTASASRATLRMPATAVAHTHGHGHRHAHNVVIVASPSRRTSLLQRQVSRALEIIELYDEHEDRLASAADGWRDVEDEETNDEDTSGRENASTANVAVHAARRLKQTSTMKRSGSGSLSMPSVFQISPNTIKRKRSHSMSSLTSGAKVDVQGLRVNIEQANHKRLAKVGNGRVTPSKRCSKDKKKKKQKVDVIERALKRFHADQTEDATRCFEFTGVCNRQFDDACSNRSETGFHRLSSSGSLDKTLDGEDQYKTMRVQVGVAAAQGARAYMEDRFSVTTRLFEDCEDDKLPSPASLLGVFDGHNGSMAAEYANDRFRELLSENDFLRDLCRRPPHEVLRAEEEEQIQEILRDAFAAVDEEVLDMTLGNNKRDGSTVLIGLLIAGKFFVANLGDTRGVWATRENEVQRVSVDHKPDLKVETKRIEEAGGKVIFSGCWRVAHDEVPLRLAVSRSLGDHPLKTNLPVSCSAPLVSVVPDIRIVDLTGQDDVIVFATDGLWDRLTDEDAIRITREQVASFCQQVSGDRNAMQHAANALVEHALHKRSMDNITAMVINFSTRSDSLDDVECDRSWAEL
ncbi:hypothetical protein Poli38472_003654 [Pythium oligandrum]|uniref:PPM-type phosphatase domain-containing protein n=1 Tax=Pythium oligandrum TaxID=41045 RepID=A0A8K1CLU0_PYTOL|nr:hypothetical protein Poli38472_003654 [Pythium oligandrum]|eukprot:TMW65889.1 hypothetical protein Poli38472_003654 [Pythium oligandrum]